MDTEIESSSNNTSLKILMLPFLAIGHVSPFMELAKNLSDRGFKIHLCSTPINLNFIKNKIPNRHSSSSIHLIELNLHESPEFPSEFHTTNGLPPHLCSAFDRALSMAGAAVGDIVGEIRPDLVVYDVLLPPWAAGVAAAHGVPAVQFFTSSSAMCSVLAHFFHRPNMEYPLLPINLTKSEQERIQKLIQHKKDIGGGVFDNNMMVISTSRELEGKYVDYLGELQQYFEVLPLGTMVQDPLHQDRNDDDFELIKWLGMRKECSTLFLCFGSECILDKEVIEEIAFGLELSQVEFLWVLRFPKGDGDEKPHNNLVEALPKGFVERVGERGRVVEGWVPQARILAHSSIGAFVSHCGWNSVMESFQYGVPVIAMPMHRVDQPVNAKLLVDMRVGVEVVRDENGRFNREEIAKVIKDVMRGKFGDDMRRNMRSIGEKVKVTSLEEMCKASKVLTQLCNKNNGHFVL